MPTLHPVDLDDLEPMTICDRCGSEIPVSEANYAGSELPTWEGATLCNECYAEEYETARAAAAERIRRAVLE